MLDPHLHYPKKKKKYFQISICSKVQNNVTSITFHVESLQNAHPSGRVFLGRVFKNAAQNILKPRFLKKIGRAHV